MSNDEQFNQEKELKYLIKSEAVYCSLQDLVREGVGLEFQTIAFKKKIRESRCFDSFEGILMAEKLEAYVGVLEKEGASITARDRITDCILTVKLPTSETNNRRESELKLSNVNFDELDPNSFYNIWSPLQEIRTLCGGKLLQEVVRLNITTNRYDLQSSNGERKLEIAVDKILATGQSNTQIQFQELEIELKEGSSLNDLDNVAEIIIKKYSAEDLIPSSLPKWIKAMKLLRKEIIG